MRLRGCDWQLCCKVLLPAPHQQQQQLLLLQLVLEPAAAEAAADMMQQVLGTMPDVAAKVGAARVSPPPTPLLPLLLQRQHPSYWRQQLLSLEH